MIGGRPAGGGTVSVAGADWTLSAFGCDIEKRMDAGSSDPARSPAGIEHVRYSTL